MPPSFPQPFPLFFFLFLLLPPRKPTATHIRFLSFLSLPLSLAVRGCWIGGLVCSNHSTSLRSHLHPRVFFGFDVTVSSSVSLQIQGHSTPTD